MPLLRVQTPKCVCTTVSCRKRIAGCCRMELSETINSCYLFAYLLTTIVYLNGREVNALELSMAKDGNAQ